MRQLLLFLLVSSIASIGMAQTRPTMTTAAESDPVATAILEKVRQKYESLSAVNAKFSLSIEIPEQPKEVQKGNFLQQGDKYRFNLAGQEAICDGKTLWLHLKNLNEVQIMDATEEEEGILSPKDLLRIYEDDNYVYALVNQKTENGKLLQQIEFKPLDKNSDYSKLRVSIDKRTNDIVRVKAFSRDGSRYTMQIDQFIVNKVVDAKKFTFNTADYPDAYIEDLRN